MKTKNENKSAPREQLADSATAAASMLSRPIEDVLRAKQAGCKAFRNSRVKVKELKDWFEDERLLFEIQNLAFVAANALKEMNLERRGVAEELAQGLKLNPVDVEEELRRLDREFFETLTLSKFLKIRNGDFREEYHGSFSEQ